MKTMLGLLITILWISVTVPFARGQHGHEEKYGRVTFPISATPEAQKIFERGVAILHSFGYEAAEKAFTATSEADPNCAMGYWGKAMCYYHPIWEPPDQTALSKGWEAVEKAKGIGAKTERERDYIAAIEVFYKDYDKLDHGTRALAYSKAMEQLSQRYPEDSEAAIFYALSLLSRALTPPTDKTYTNQKKAGEILEKVFAKQPEHPGIVHYIIHAYDYPILASRALTAARTYARIAPSAPHALHMPSHIFTRLGLWKESAESNAASATAAKQVGEKLHIGTRDQLHAMDYMMYAYLQLGLESDAKRVLDDESKIEASERDDWASAYAHAAIPARYVIEGRRWSEAATLTPKPTRYPYAKAITYFARAIGAVRTGDTAVARDAIEKLQIFRDNVSLSKESYSWVVDQIEVQRRAASGWFAWLEGRNEEAVQLLRSAADFEDASEKDPVTPGPIVPARELLGELLLELSHPTEAEREFLASLKVSPNRARGIFGAARAAELSGDTNTAKELYTKFLALWNGADNNKPELKIAQAYLGK